MRWCLFFLLTSPVLAQQPAGEPDYPAIFGSDYDFAINTIEKNAWWSDSLTNHGIDPHFAMAIVFPELIRYSSIQDFIEVKALEVLYVQYGEDYADFSVGLFQVKPSFAEQIEADMLEYKIDKDYPSLTTLHPTTDDNAENRGCRVTRLKDQRFQLLYLEAYIRVMARLYPEFENATPTEKLLFYSTAYNAGYHKKPSVIFSEMCKNRFYRGMIEPKEKYNYARIADWYFTNGSH